MGTVYTESKTVTDWLKGETADPTDFSRETITVLAGETLVTGTVLGKITTGGKFVGLTPGAGDGSQAAAGILYTKAVVAESGVDKLAVAIVRDAVFIRDGLVWPVGISGGQIATAIAELRALGLIEREGA